MRKQALVCAAALAVGIVSSMAQNVYSLNVVGYYNVTVPANQYVLIANQLNTTNNTIGSILANVPPGSQLQKYAGGFSAYAFDEFDLAWVPNGNATINPGEGFYFSCPVATTLTFVGEVAQGQLVNTLPIGQYAVRSSIVPQQGTPTALGIPAEPGDQLQTYAGGFTAYSFDEFDLAWVPSVPTLGVGQAFFYQKSPTGTQSTWTRNFTVN